MKIRCNIEEFKDGSFILEFYDKDLMIYPMRAKMITPPSKIKFMEELPDEINDMIFLPSVEDMSHLDILFLTRNLSITYSKFEESEPLSYRINYGKYINGYNIYSLMELNELSNGHIDSMKIEIPGLTLLVHYDEYSNKVFMESSAFFYGNDNCIIRWYLQVLNKLIDMKLCLGQNAH